MTDLPDIQTCGMCGNPKRVRTVQTDVPDTQPVELGICRLCDTRQCGGCGEYEQDPHTFTCSNCGRNLRA